MITVAALAGLAAVMWAAARVWTRLGRNDTDTQGDSQS